MPPLPFHARLLEFRHRNIMTAAECSRLFGVSYATYSSWESGRREPPDWVQGLVLLRLRAAVKRRKAP